MSSLDLAINKLNGTQTPRMRSLVDVTKAYGQKGGERFMSGFLPEGYTVPDSNDKYMKFQPNENRFRVLSEKAITGWEWWVTNGEGKRSPRRIPSSQQIPMSEVEEPDKIKHFWAFVAE